MKKLIKLQINSEKILKNDELIALKGGLACTCTCYRSDDNYCYGYWVSPSGDCEGDCPTVWAGSTGKCGNLYEQCSNQPG